jgi:hypothetical protein
MKSSECLVFVNVVGPDASDKVMVLRVLLCIE